MTELPPDENSPDGVDEQYRRASSREVSRPSETVRRAVLQHASDLAAQRASAKRPVDVDFKQRAANQAWRRPAAYGGLAAAALAGLLIAPHFLTPASPPVEIAQVGAPAAAPPSPSPSAGAPAAAPAPAPAPEPDVRGGFLAGNLSRERSRGDRAGRLAADNSRALAAKSSAQNAPNAEQLGASDSASAESAPPASGGSSSLPRIESFARQATPVPAAPAASSSARAAARPIDSASALRQAAAFGDLPRLRALLAEQPEIDARDSTGRSALMLAVLDGQIDAVDLLLASGADANAADSNGTTPLQAVLARNRSAIVDALRRAGAR